MKIVPPEPSVDLYNEGFEEPDILQRRNTGDALSDLLNRIDDPLVVALDGRWGTGKTHFLKRWAGAHEGATAVYFDAFAHDYISDPLPALVSVPEERLAGTGCGQRPVLGNGRDHLLNVSILYHTWLYLSQDDRFDEYGPEFLAGIPEQFGRTPFLEDPKTIPKMAHRQWLDRFSFYTSDQP